VTRGQTAVFYEGERVVGGGRIAGVAHDAEREHDGTSALALPFEA
jgi:hypothetical protein